MKTNKTNIKNLLFLPALIAGLDLIPAGPATAQVFTTIKSFGILTNITGFNPQSTLVQGPDGTLYGTASDGEGSVAGTIFKVQPDGSGFRVLKWLTNSIEGAYPIAGVAVSGSVLYGTTAYGGSSNYGTVFKIGTDGTGYTVLKSFTGSDGAIPYYAALTLSGSVLYGTTYYGGSSTPSSSYGALFKLNTDGTGYTVLKSFANTNGANSNFALTLSGSVLYGTTENGGSSGYGTVFKIATDGTGYTVLKNFTDNPDGAYPDGVLTLSGGVLYGTTYRGGSSFYGTLFKVNTDGTGYTVLKNFANNDGAQPSGPLPLSGNVLYGTTGYGGSSGSGTVFRMNTDGTAYTVLKNFISYTDGYNPLAGLMLSSGVLYGTTTYGGNSGPGTVFKVNTDGTGFALLVSFDGYVDANPLAGPTVSGSVIYGSTATDISHNHPGNGTLFKVNTDGTDYTVLKNFAGTDGANPQAVLTLSDGVLYGATYDGGNSNYGTVFQVNTDGTGYTVLKHFTGSDGANPYTPLTLSDGALFGTTSSGGSSNNGTVFRVNTDGTGYAVLKDFTNSADGTALYAGLTLSGSVLYGTTTYGGSSDNGTVFKLNTDGTGYTVLKNFDGWPTDGAGPQAGLTLSGGVLYGTIFEGGSLGIGAVFKINTDGTGYTVLKDFTNYADAKYPLSALALSGSALYGTTSQGGSTGNGTIFKINTDGTGYTVVKNFNGNDGASPFGDLALSGGVLYGTTSGGGPLGAGTVFSLSLPRPQLTITSSGTPPSRVILSWPTNVAGSDYTGYTLQSTTNLLSPTGWVTNSATPVVMNGQNTVTNLIAGPQNFYRLIH